MKAINIRFSDEEYQALKQLSQQKEMSINNIVREAVRNHITNLQGIEEGLYSGVSPEVHTPPPLG